MKLRLARTMPRSPVSTRSSERERCTPPGGNGPRGVVGYRAFHPRLQPVVGPRSPARAFTRRSPAFIPAHCDAGGALRIFRPYPRTTTLGRAHPIPSRHTPDERHPDPARGTPVLPDTEPGSSTTAAAQAGHLERGGGAGGIHHRQRHLPRSQHRRRPRGDAGRVLHDLDRGRAGGADGRAHHRRAGGHVPALRRHLRLSARGVRAAAGVPLRLDGAAGHPPQRAGRHRHDLRGVRGAAVRLRPGVGAMGGRGRHPAAGPGEHPLGTGGARWCRT